MGQISPRPRKSPITLLLYTRSDDINDMKMAKKNYYCVSSISAAAITILLPFSVFGSEGTGNETLSTSGGIAAASSSSAVFQNPALLIYNSSFKLTTQAGAEDSFSHPTFRGGILGGNGSFGGAAGVSSNHGGDSTSAFYGLGVSLGSLGASLGVSGSTNLSSSGGSTFNAGLAVHPMEQFRMGFTTFGLNDGVNEWGAGFATTLASSLNFVLDATLASKASHLAAQPGILVGGPPAALTVSYGIGGGSAELSDGLALGGSIQVGSSASLQIYYNQLSRYYAALTFSL